MAEELQTLPILLGMKNGFANRRAERQHGQGENWRSKLLASGQGDKPPMMV